MEVKDVPVDDDRQFLLDRRQRKYKLMEEILVQMAIGVACSLIATSIINYLRNQGWSIGWTR